MRLSIWLLLFLLTGCRREPEPAHALTYQVPEEVIPFVEQFKAEALQRGQTLPVNDLIVQFGKTSAENICAVSLIRQNQTPVITISIDPNCWKSAYKEAKEALIFHELGHCILKRDHRNDRLPDGSYTSLMNLDDVGIYATCQYPIDNSPCDKRPRRAYYIDELFDSRTPVPAWAK